MQSPVSPDSNFRFENSDKHNHIENNQTESQILPQGTQLDKLKCADTKSKSEQRELTEEIQRLSSPHVKTNEDLSCKEKEYWQKRMPHGFQFYLEKLASAVIRHKPKKLLLFSAIYLEEQLVTRNAELYALPSEPYFVRLHKRRCNGETCSYNYASRSLSAATKVKGAAPGSTSGILTSGSLPVKSETSYKIPKIKKSKAHNSKVEVEEDSDDFIKDSPVCYFL